MTTKEFDMNTATLERREVDLAAKIPVHWTDSNVGKRTKECKQECSWIGGLFFNQHFIENYKLFECKMTLYTLKLISIREDKKDKWWGKIEVEI